MLSLHAGWEVRAVAVCKDLDSVWIWFYKEIALTVRVNFLEMTNRKVTFHLDFL